MTKKEKSIFVGEYRQAIDEKKRAIIPSKWRFSGDDKEVCLALPNSVDCLTIYPPKMVIELEEKIEEVSLGNKKGHRTLIHFFSRPDYFSCDKRCHINMNVKLGAHVDYSNEAMLVGNFVTFNIWNLERYVLYFDFEGYEPYDLSEIFTELGV